MQNSSARSVKSSMRSRSAACMAGSSSERWILADWIAAPSSGGWTGPEKIIGPPVVRTLRVTLGVREDDRAAGGGEGLVQRAGRDQARVPAQRVQRRAAAVLARPADAVRVVDVEVQLLVAVQQRGSSSNGAKSANIE